MDSRDGNDTTCNGLYPSPQAPYTVDCPWASVNKVNTDASCNPGDTFSFVDGATWSEQSPSSTTAFLHPCNGASGGTDQQSNAIHITSYCNPDETHAPYDCRNINDYPPNPILAGNGDQATVYLDNQQGWDIESANHQLANGRILPI